MLHFSNQRRIFSLVKTVFFTCEFFPTSRNHNLYEWKPYFKSRPYSCLETHLLDSGNHFLPLPQILFKEFLIPDSGNTFFSPKEEVLFFTQGLFSCQWKPLFKLQRSLFKALVTAIDNNFIRIFRYSCRLQFFLLVETYS